MNHETFKKVITRLCFLLTIVFFLSLAWQTIVIARRAGKGSEPSEDEEDNTLKQVWALQPSSNNPFTQTSSISNGVYCDQMRSLIVFITNNSVQSTTTGNNVNSFLLAYDYEDTSWHNITVEPPNGYSESEVLSLFSRDGGTVTLLNNAEHNNVNTCGLFVHGGKVNKTKMILTSLLLSIEKESGLNDNTTYTASFEIINGSLSNTGYASSTAYFDYAVYVFGGLSSSYYENGKLEDNYINDIHRFNVSTRLWSKITPKYGLKTNPWYDKDFAEPNDPLHRYYHKTIPVSVVVKGSSSSDPVLGTVNYILLYGGRRSYTSGTLGDIDVYNIQENTFYNLISESVYHDRNRLFYSRYKAEMIYSSNGNYLYIFGGLSAGFGEKTVRHQGFLVTKLTFNFKSFRSNTGYMDLEASCRINGKTVPYCVFDQDEINRAASLVVNRSTTENIYSAVEQSSVAEEKEIVFMSDTQSVSVFTELWKQFMLSNSNGIPNAGAMNIVTIQLSTILSNLFIYVPDTSATYLIFQLILLISVISFILAAVLLMIQRQPYFGFSRYSFSNDPAGFHQQQSGTDESVIKSLPTFTFNKVEYLQSKRNMFDVKANEHVEIGLNDSDAPRATSNQEIELTIMDNSTIQHNSDLVQAENTDVPTLEPTAATNTETDTVCCCICITDFEDGDICRVLPCGHLFHPQCVDTWLRKNKSCPMCKQDVVDSSGELNASYSSSSTIAASGSNIPSTANSSRRLNTRIRCPRIQFTSHLGILGRIRSRRSRRTAEVNDNSSNNNNNNNTEDQNRRENQTQSGS